MEESEKRKERLMAMRMEAARAGADSSSSGLSSSCLSNPLIESSSPAPTHFAPRFDYYTDPMSAFSGSRRNNNTPHVFQGHYSAPQKPVYRGRPPGPVYHSPGSDSPGPGIFQAPMTHYNRSPVGSPMPPSFGPQQGHPPNTWGGSSTPFNYNTPPSNLSRDGTFSHPGNPPYVSYGQENPPYVSYGQGRGQRFNPGRSRGSPGNSQSPRSGFGGRRGSGSHGPVSAEQQPYRYYRKEMVQDPWEMLTPVVWKDTQARDSDKSWLPKSISMKKAKVSGEASQPSISQQSLAEYLAASFKDSTDEAVDDEPGS
ncbi:hypothetical protein ACS0TY_000610 [Phlomoides rotata]